MYISFCVIIVLSGLHGVIFPRTKVVILFLNPIFSHFDQILLLRLLSQSSEVEHNPKMSISFFDDLDGLFLHFGQLSLCRSLSQSSEVKSNPKMSISFFDDLGGLFCIPVDFHSSDRSVDHQKLNIIQKQAFHFLMT